MSDYNRAMQEEHGMHDPLEVLEFEHHADILRRFLGPTDLSRATTPHREALQRDAAFVRRFWGHTTPAAYPWTAENPSPMGFGR